MLLNSIVLSEEYSEDQRIPNADEKTEQLSDGVVTTTISQIHVGDMLS